MDNFIIVPRLHRNQNQMKNTLITIQLISVNLTQIGTSKPIKIYYNISNNSNTHKLY